MTENVIVQILNTVGLVLVAFIGSAKLGRIGKDAKAVRDQTENSHQDQPGLRDDIDTIKRGQSDTRRDLGDLRDEIREGRRVFATKSDLEAAEYKSELTHEKIWQAIIKNEKNEGRKSS